MEKELELAVEKIQKRKFSEAIILYEQILKKDTKNFDANLNLGAIYAQTNNLQKASEYWIKAIKINPNNSDVNNNLAAIEINLKNYEKAIEYAQNAIKLNSNFYSAYNNLGIALKEAGKLEESKSSFLDAIKINPKGFLAYFNLGVVYYELNEVDKCEKSYIKSIQENPKYINSYINLLNLYEKLNHTQKLSKLLSEVELIFPANNSFKLIKAKLNFKIENYNENIELLKSISFKELNITNEITRLSLLARSHDKVGKFSDAFKLFTDSNNLNMSINSKKFNKINALNIIKERYNYFKNQKQYKNLKKNNNKSSSDPIFLVGFPRSGTTLLDSILRSHPKVEVIEEKPIIKNFIKKLNTETFYNLENLKNLEETFLNEIREYYLNFRSKYTFANKDIVIDKMPLNLIHAAEIIRVFPDAKFILAIRHPCDCILSSFMQNFAINDSMANLTSLNDATHFYIEIMKLWDIYENKLELNHHEVRYEDIVNNFREEINKILHFLNLEWSDEIMQFNETAKKRGLISTPSYEQVNKPIYFDSIKRWKNYENEFSDLILKIKPWIKKYNY